MEEGDCYSDYDEPEQRMEVQAGFVLHALPGPGRVDEIDQKFVAAIVPGFNTSFGDIMFESYELKAVAAFLRSLMV